MYLWYRGHLHPHQQEREFCEPYSRHNRLRETNASMYVCTLELFAYEVVAFAETLVDGLRLDIADRGVWSPMADGQASFYVRVYEKKLTILSAHAYRTIF